MTEPREPHPEGEKYIDYQKVLEDSFDKLVVNENFIIVVGVYKYFLKKEDDEKNLKKETETLIKNYLIATILGELYKIIYGREHDEEDDDDELIKYINLIKIDLNSKTGVLRASFMKADDEEGLIEFTHERQIFTV